MILRSCSFPSYPPVEMEAVSELSQPNPPLTASPPPYIFSVQDEGMSFFASRMPGEACLRGVQQVIFQNFCQSQE